MRSEVNQRFGHLLKGRAAIELAEWLIDEDGHDMQYDIEANHAPIQAYESGKGNCLSFTMLLAALAEELDIEIKFNAVDIPNTWGMDEDLGMVFYRHVNGVMLHHNRRQIFDLAMELYDSGYPQKFISRDEGIALLLNNRAIAAQSNGKYIEALHNLKVAVSLSPKNPDLWANLGVVLKRLEKYERAELSFSYAFDLDNYNIPATSNLERLYRERGKNSKALAFKKRADRARQTNPYFHYQLAMDDFREVKLRSAQRSIDKALLLHAKDPRFHELKSRISQRQHKYGSAIKSLSRAYALASSEEQQGKYLTKVDLVTKHATQEYERRMRLRNQTYEARQSLLRNISR